MVDLALNKGVGTPSYPSDYHTFGNAIALTTHLTTSVCSDYKMQGDEDVSTHSIAVRVYNDARVSWNPAFDNRLAGNVGVNNLFNVDPPLCYSCARNGFNGWTWDVPGVFAYISAAYTTQ
jgi:outer membrane receptor protein involved in Fe transport